MTSGRTELNLNWVRRVNSTELNGSELAWYCRWWIRAVNGSGWTRFTNVSDLISKPTQPRVPDTFPAATTTRRRQQRRLVTTGSRGGLNESREVGGDDAAGDMLQWWRQCWPWFTVAVSAADSAGTETGRSRRLGLVSGDTRKALHRKLKKIWKNHDKS